MELTINYASGQHILKKLITIQYLPRQAEQYIV